MVLLKNKNPKCHIGSIKESISDQNTKWGPIYKTVASKLWQGLLPLPILNRITAWVR